VQLCITTEPQQGATYDDLLRVAQAAEQLGFHGFFRSDHYLTMGTPSGLPGMTDAWLTLAALARETSRIRLGTLVTPVTFRLPTALAIAVAQVDQMSGGRVELGMGAGWYRAEHANYGIPFPDVGERFERLAEQLEVVDGMLTTPPGGSFTHAGRHYRVDSTVLPRPVQTPRPPIIIGGSAKRRGASLAARFADEFNSAFRPLDETAGLYDAIRSAAAVTGRRLTYSVAHTGCIGKDDREVARRAEAIGRSVDALRAKGLTGTPGEVVEQINAYAAIGTSRVYLQILDLRDLDHLDLIAAEVLPYV
jgi:F420-dependent oxidoreductase-like protein